MKQRECPQSGSGQHRFTGYPRERSYCRYCRAPFGAVLMQRTLERQAAALRAGVDAAVREGSPAHGLFQQVEALREGKTELDKLLGVADA